MESLNRLAAQAAELLAGHPGPVVHSLECGRGHLDREPDADQAAGVAIGAAVQRRLAAEQPRPPLLTPLMDDDQVLVRQPPSAYLGYLRRHLPEPPRPPVPQSSPVLRAIAAVLHARLLALHPPGGLHRRAGGLFLRLPDGSDCELLEDAAGARITGGVLLEAALLVYRTAPDLFDTHFRLRFGPDGDVHRAAAAILDVPGPAEETLQRLHAYYARFTAVTDPEAPDSGVRLLVDQALAGPPVAHLNVLPDYHASRQHKVRGLLGLLRLPVALLSLHFSVAGERVTLTSDRVTPAGDRVTPTS
ncbi:hypothetical protein [Kitasatospora sp. MMS16-BH015]|uniref:hypothetical protein n=1 Tax=Kitasatospora sp. MMS16-BH015 TaxID=2018025 RepID=UPI000CF29BF8|nr:hypothetical protein [Kitasatospora sp. MMS16-BH015]